MRGIVLEAGEAFDKPHTTFVDEEGGFGAVVGIAETAQDFGPAWDTVGVGFGEADAEVIVLLGDGEAVALDGEAIMTGGEKAEFVRIKIVAVEHGANGAV